MSGGSVKSAERTLRLLEIVARHRNGVSFVALEEESQFPKSSLHGLLHTMVEMRWLSFDPEQRSYSTGVRTWEVGATYRPGRELAVSARPFVLAASRALGETVHLAVLDGEDVVYLDRVEGAGTLRLVSEIGARLPAYATGVGKALLAELPEAELLNRFQGREMARFTSQTETSGSSFLDTLRSTRERGYAEDEGEYTLGVTCVAAVIRNGHGSAVAALSCSAPTARVEGGEITRETMRAEILLRSAEISAALGTPLSLSAPSGPVVPG